MILDHKNDFPKNEKNNILVIGTSNSIIRGGWFESFNNKLSSQFNIINLSLGSCTSLYLAYQVVTNSELFLNSDIIIIEPIVNDISHLPNKQITQETLFQAIDFLYTFIGSLNKKSFTLLLPTQKRTAQFYNNIVYQKHISSARSNSIIPIDLHPLFESQLCNLERLFLDPGHINLDLAFHLGETIGDVIKFNNLEKNDLSFKISDVNNTYKIIELKKNSHKKNSQFEAELLKLDDSIFIDIPDGYQLCGIMHWNDHNLTNIETITSGSNNSESIELKSKYLKLTTPRKLISSSFTIKPNQDGIYIHSLMLEKFKGNSYEKFHKPKKTNFEKLINTYISNTFYKFLNFYSNQDFISENYHWLYKRENFNDLLKFKNLVNHLIMSKTISAEMKDSLSKCINNEIRTFWGQE